MDNPTGPTRSGLEERLREGGGVLKSGKELTSSQHGVVNEAIREFFDQGRAVEAGEKTYGHLDPEGVLKGLGVKVWLLEGLNSRILELARDRKVVFRDTLVAHPGTMGTGVGGSSRQVYVDGAQGRLLGELEVARRAEWARHEAVHLQHPDWSEETVQGEEPLEDLLAALKVREVEQRLPAVVVQVLSVVGQSIPDADKRYMLKLIETHRRSPQEIAVAVSSALARNVTPGELLKMGERHGMTVPVAAEAFDIAQAHKRSPLLVGEMARQIFQAEYGKGADWEGAPVDQKLEILDRASDLVEFWDGLMEENDVTHKIYRPFSFRLLLKLYNAVRDVDELKRVVEELIAGWENTKKGVARNHAVLNDLIVRIDQAGGYRDDLLEDVEERLAEWGVELDDLPDPDSQSGLEEAEGIRWGQGLTPSQESLIQEVRRESEMLTGLPRSRSGWVRDRELEAIDPRGILAAAGLSVHRVDLLSEQMRKRAALDGVPLPEQLILAHLLREKKILVVDSSFLVGWARLPDESREALVRYYAGQMKPEFGLPRGQTPVFHEIFDELSHRLHRSLLRPFPFEMGLGIRPLETPGPTDVIQNVWRSGEGRPFTVSQRPAVRALLEKKQVSEQLAVQNLRTLLEAIRDVVGYPLDPEIELASGQPSLLRLDGYQLTVDVSMLALPNKLFQSLIAYALDHLRQVDDVALSERADREIMAYFWEAEQWIHQEKLPLQELREAFRLLQSLGWDSQPHIQFVEAAAAVHGMEQVGRLRHRWTNMGPQLEEANFMARTLGKQLALPGRSSIPREMTAPVFGEPTVARSLKKGHFLVPLESEIRRARVIQPGLSREQVFEILSANPDVLRILRYLGPEEVTILWVLWDRENLLADLRKGRLSLVRANLDRQIPEFMHGVHPDRTYRGASYMVYNQAVKVAAFLIRILGAGELQKILAGHPFPSRTAAIGLLRDTLVGGKPKQLLSKRILKSEFELFSSQLDPDLQDWLSKVSSGDWHNGMDSIRQGGRGQGILKLLTAIRSSRRLQEEFVTAFDGSVETSAVRETSEALLAAVLRRWGMAIAPALRSAEAGGDVESILVDYAQVFSDFVERVEPRVISEEPSDALLEGVLRFSGWLKRVGSAEFMNLVRARVDEAWPLMVSIELGDPSDRYATERAGFLYLTEVDEPSTRWLSDQFASYLEMKQGAAPASCCLYGTQLLRRGTDPAALARIGAQLVGLFPSLSTDAARRFEGFWIGILASRPPELRRAILEQMVRTQDGFVTLFTSPGATVPIREFLLLHLDPQVVADRLAGLPASKVSQLYQGVDPRLVRRTTEAMPAAKESADIVHRHVYQEMVQSLPEQVPDRSLGGEVPNHYRTLAIPRSAPLNVVKRSYRKLSIVFHPDVVAHMGPAEARLASETMAKINEAYDILGDSEKRADYASRIANQSAFYPSQPWYERVPPEQQVLPAERIGDSDSQTTAGLEEDPDRKEVRALLQKLRTGTTGQRQLALRQVELWLTPAMAPALAQEQTRFIEALEVNLTYPDSKVRGEASRMLTEVLPAIPGVDLRSELLNRMIHRMGHDSRGVRETHTATVQALIFRPNDSRWATGVLTLLPQQGAIARVEQEISLLRMVPVLSRRKDLDVAGFTPLVPMIQQGIHHPNSHVVEAAQGAATALLSRGVPLETLSGALDSSLENARVDQPEAVRRGAFLTFREAAEKGLDSPRAERVLNLSLESVSGGGIHPDTLVAIFEMWGAFARHRLIPDRVTSTLPLLLTYGQAHDQRVAVAAWDAAGGVVGQGAGLTDLRETLQDSLSSLRSSDEAVGLAAERYLTKLAQQHRLDLLLEATELLLAQRQSAVPEVRRRIDETLLAFAALPEIGELLDRKGLTPATLGINYPVPMGWKEVTVFSTAWQGLIASPAWADLTLGARAVLRRLLLRQVRTTSEPGALTGQIQQLAEHLLRKERLEQRGLALPTMGSELHLDVPPAEFDPLSLAAASMASNVGNHTLTTAQVEGPRQIDLRLLPAYPAAFSWLLELFLEQEEMKRYPIIGAHYTVGWDLSRDLSALILSLFYGDTTYPWLPIPRGGADVGFPGVYTYVGATLDPNTGIATSYRQSNLHLRPLRVLESVSIGAGERMIQPLNLFPNDVDRIAWLSLAAHANRESSLGELYARYEQGWYRWLADLGSPLADQMRAQEGVTPAQAQNRSDWLDQMSRSIYEALYRIDVNEVQEQEIKVPPVKNQQIATPQRVRLERLIDQTIQRVQEIQVPNPVAREAVLKYRAAKTLEAMEEWHPKAVQALTDSFFGLLRYERDQELQHLKVLHTLDPDRAANVAAALQMPLPAVESAGLEERWGRPALSGAQEVIILGPEALAVLEAVPMAHRQGGRPVAVASVVRSQRQEALFRQRADQMGLEIAAVVNAEQEPYRGDWEAAVADLAAHFESKRRSAKIIMTVQDLSELGRFLGVPDLGKFVQAGLEEVRNSAERYL